MPKIAKQINKDGPEYLEKRAKNNEAIKRTRDKAKAKATETETRLENLRTDNKRMEDKISVLDQQMKFLKDVYHTHTQAKNERDTTVGVPSMGQDNIEFLDSFLNQM
eukprot:TRINITY_DN11836_c0_g1_i1.p1 TRINITY_DN11836_c0_g1~~TRINITY_DN11836_c0_g1_i1.p1  ORF type:complete len:107 (-),score=35.58 TRINITY_DN11836_c0_g1_i1:105-425(-)